RRKGFAKVAKGLPIRIPFCVLCETFATFASGCPLPHSYFGNRSRNFSFQNFPVDVLGTASMNS
ncbi:MAG: hypothetical protein K0S48_3188, partial [Ramlibacter sp.]|nr:hypothetical protein [Ramlibacter sp.]